MKVKEESETAGLKLNIHKTNIMASGPNTSWQIDGEAMETMRYFILGDSKITADVACRRHRSQGGPVLCGQPPGKSGEKNE